MDRYKKLKRRTFPGFSFQQHLKTFKDEIEEHLKSVKPLTKHNIIFLADSFTKIFKEKLETRTCEFCSFCEQREFNQQCHNKDVYALVFQNSTLGIFETSNGFDCGYFDRGCEMWEIKK